MHYCPKRAKRSSNKRIKLVAMLTWSLVIPMAVTSYFASNQPRPEMLSPLAPEKPQPKYNIVYAQTVEEPETAQAVVKHEPAISDEIEKYICTKDWDCKTAIAILKHENGYQLRNDWDAEIEVENTNGSIDVGIAMINSIHHAKYGGKEALKDYKTNVDAAYQIYLERLSFDVDGFNAWYSYVNGKHLMFM